MPPIMPLSRLYAGFLDLLYPRRCPVCSEIVMPKGNLICPDCNESFPFGDREDRWCMVVVSSCREMLG